MNLNLRSYTKNIFCLIIASFLFTLPAFAQSAKPKLANQTRANSQAEPVLTLTPDNLQKEAYKMWFFWYKAQQQGKIYPQPTLDLPRHLDIKEANRVRTVWQQAQQQAQRDAQSQAKVIKKMDMASAYKIWADWYSAQQQGRRIAMPNLIVSNVGQKEAQRVQAMWEQARIKAQKDIQAQVASNRPQQSTQINNQPQNIQTVASSQTNTGVHLSSAVAGGTPNTRLFAGQEYDPDLGLYFNRDRYLNTATGRFLTQDTFEGSVFNPQSLHKYAYAHNNPVNNLDPTGRSIATIAATFNYALPLVTTPTRSINSFFAQSNAPQFVGGDAKAVNEALTEARNQTAKRGQCDTALFEVKNLGTSLPNVYSLNALVSQLNPLTNLFDGRKSTYIPQVAGNPKKLSIQEIFKENPQAAAVTTLYNNLTAVFVNKPFFTFNDFPQFARATVLLHESVHAFGGLDDLNFGKTVAEGSFFLNTKIASACYPVAIADDTLRIKIFGNLTSIDLK